jgi:DNA-binding transcriptional MerR regulator
MYKIGDFSRLGQVSVRMLRHYDKLGLLEPSHVDPFTGYRYYTLDQLATLHRIVALNGLGLTLTQIAPLVRAGHELPAEQLRGMLLLRQSELALELQEKQLQLASVAARLQQLDQTGAAPQYDIALKRVPGLAVAAVREVVPRLGQVGDYCGRMYGHLYATLARHGITPADLELTLYRNEQYAEQNIDMEVAAVVERDLLGEHPAEETVRFYELPEAEQAATLIYEGSFQEVTAAVLTLLSWVGAQRLLPAGPLRELHHSGRAHSGGEARSHSLLELQLPVRPLA